MKTICCRLFCRRHIVSLLLVSALLCLGGTGCESDGDAPLGSGHDFGENDANLYAALGDSITYGRTVPAGAPYPERLAGMLGKTVLNYGVPGQRAFEGAARVSGVLSRKPGFLLILFGSNDAITSVDPVFTKESLRSIVLAARGNKTIPVIATIPPMTGTHAAFAGAARTVNGHIRALASEEGVTLVDLESSFGSGSGYLDADGLHPNDAGTQRMAEGFFGVLN